MANITLKFIGKNSSYKAGEVTFTKASDTKTVPEAIGNLLLEKEPEKFIKVDQTKKQIQDEIKVPVK